MKFLNENILKIFKNIDIIVINDRARCPEGFTLISRSKKTPSKDTRGGVAVFLNSLCNFQLEVICDSLNDSSICKIKDSDFIISAVYIPPSNLIYFNGIYFKNLDLIYEKFKNHKLLVIGDMNSRIGSVPYNNASFRHHENPDTFVNRHGRKLRKWINNTNMILLNGLTTYYKKFGSKYTFYRGKLFSQNDLVFSNDISYVDSLKILEKNIYSDHCPISVSCTVLISVSLDDLKKLLEWMF